MTEEWKPISGYEGFYEVSNLGNVRSVDRYGMSISTSRWKNSMNAQVGGRYQTRKQDRSSSATKWRIGIIMANRGDVISVDKLWDIFDLEREKAWDGVDVPVGSPEWNVAAGKIDVINNICDAVHGMNTCSRSDGEKAEKPVWKVKSSIVHTDYADGSADTKTVQRASWCCPICDWFVGEQVEVFGRKHNQQKKNFCDRCGQKIDWEGVEE